MLMILMSVAPAAAMTGISQLIDGCVKAAEAGKPVVFPYRIKRVATGPDVFQQAYKVEQGDVSVTMVSNPDPDNPINFVCNVDGVRMKDTFRASKITVGWAAVDGIIKTTFQSLARTKGLKVINDRLRESNLGVEGYQLVKCGGAGAVVLLGPSRMSDSGFLTPPFHMEGLSSATFSFSISSPLSQQMHQKHCN